MELWIRSQDRTRLVPVTPLIVEKEEYIKDVLPFVIYTYYEDYKIRLGYYKTKEKALEVLDEITDFIDGLNRTNTITIYEMPIE